MTKPIDSAFRQKDKLTLAEFTQKRHDDFSKKWKHTYDRPMLVIVRDIELEEFLTMHKENNLFE